MISGRKPRSTLVAGFPLGQSASPCGGPAACGPGQDQLARPTSVSSRLPMKAVRLVLERHEALGKPLRFQRDRCSNFRADSRPVASADGVPAARSNAPAASGLCPRGALSARPKAVFHSRAPPSTGRPAALARRKKFFARASTASPAGHTRGNFVPRAPRTFACRAVILTVCDRLRTPVLLCAARC